MMEILSQQIVDLLNDNKNFAVATILTHKGSTPRTSGSKMIVLKDRTIHGTIGGGLVEAMVMDGCIDLLKKEKCAIKEFTLDQDLKDGLDMVCGGTLSILIETFVQNRDSDSKHGPELKSVSSHGRQSGLATLFSSLSDLEKKGKKGFLVSKIQGVSKSDFTMERCLVMPDGKTVGKDILPKSLLGDILDNKFHGPSPVIHNLNFEEFIIAPIEPMECLFIFGAGHVGYQLASIAHIADFQTVVIDDREVFANSRRFPYARKIHAVKHFSNAFDDLEIDNNSYIVILTRGHLHDQSVLENALKTSPAYIGMIGSRGKRDTIYANLMKKGVSQNALDTVCSPIGMKIEAQTPAEIAVSIMGEIIKRKYTKPAC